MAYTGGLDESLAFLFRPDFHKLTSSAVLEALGHAFFTLSLGMGAMVTYGSYLNEERRVIRDSVAIAALDTIVALLAGTVIFAVVFRADLEPSAGPGLLFQTLPGLFVKMPGGRVRGQRVLRPGGVRRLELGHFAVGSRRGLRRRRVQSASLAGRWGIGAAIWGVWASPAPWA